MASTIANGKNTPLNVRTGTVPDLSGGMRDWFQLMIFEPTIKNESGFQVIETAEPIKFWGTIQPLNSRQLYLKPEGQRAWTWLQLHADPVLSLEVDQVVFYLGVQTRVMALKNYALYGYVEYHLVQDWTGSGPNPSPVVYYIYGGSSSTTYFDPIINGGVSNTPVFDGVVNGGDAFGN